MRDLIRRVGSTLDGWDWFLLIAAAMMFAGLTLTFTVGVALIVVGVLGLVFGLYGARGAEIAALIEARRKANS